MNIITSMFQYDFMKNALIAILLLSLLFGVLGTMIVHKGMAYFSDALGHSAFTGVAIGLILGLANPTVSMVIFAIIFSLLLNAIKRRNTQTVDTVISVFASLATALGLAILSMDGQFSSYSNLLVGDVLAISTKEIIALGVLLIITLAFWCGFINQLTVISIHETLAKSRGIKVRLLEDIFSILIALVVMLSIQWVGLLLINALLILPAAASKNVSINMLEYHIFSIVFALVAGISGLFVSYCFGMATGPAIVLIAAIIYFVTYLIGKE